MGDYDENLINFNCSTLGEEIPFHVVIVHNQRDQNEKSVNMVLVVPAYWVDQTFRYVLHPNPEFHINGMYPRYWNEMAFNRCRYPTDKFVEYEVADFENDMSGKCTGKYTGNAGYGSEKSYTMFTRTVPTSLEVLSSRQLELTGEDIRRPFKSFYKTPRSDVATTSFSNIGNS